MFIATSGQHIEIRKHQRHHRYAAVCRTHGIFHWHRARIRFGRLYSCKFANSNLLVSLFSPVCFVAAVVIAVIATPSSLAIIFIGTLFVVRLWSMPNTFMFYICIRNPQSTHSVYRVAEKFSSYLRWIGSIPFRLIWKVSLRCQRNSSIANYSEPDIVSSHELQIIWLIWGMGEKDLL